MGMHCKPFSIQENTARLPLKSYAPLQSFRWEDARQAKLTAEYILLLQTGQYSTQIFSLAVLLSSLFVYNQMGGIDEAALDRLSLVTEMTKHVRVRAGAAAGALLVARRTLLRWLVTFLLWPLRRVLFSCWVLMFTGKLGFNLWLYKRPDLQIFFKKKPGNRSSLRRSLENCRAEHWHCAGEGEAELADFTPSFLWLLRDFYLTLEEDGRQAS